MKQTVPASSELRKHYYRDQYVVIAPGRGQRPDSFAAKLPSHKQETAKSPAIERDPAILTIPGDNGRWAVKVIANKFPALSLDNKKAFGKQEIVVETPEHNLEFSDLSVAQIMRVFVAYSSRLKSLSKLAGIRYVSVFKNDGQAAGASIAHAHSQITALPIVPPDLESEAIAADEYFDEHQSCPVCDLLAWELEQKVRVIYQDKSVVAIAPYASRYAYEVWIIPRRHAGNFTDLKHDELHSTATILKNVTAKLDEVNMSYNFFLQNALAKRDHHFILKLEPRPSVWAGLELSTGLIINQTAPELAALWYTDRL